MFNHDLIFLNHAQVPYWTTYYFHTPYIFNPQNNPFIWIRVRVPAPNTDALNKLRALNIEVKVNGFPLRHPGFPYTILISFQLFEIKGIPLGF